MKKWKIAILVMTFVLIFISNTTVYAESLSEKRLEEINKDFRGLWVATVLNLDYPSKQGVSETLMKNEAIEILNQVEALGLNAVVLQVRPTADSFFPSEIFPWSKYLTGKQGVQPLNAFDPLKFWIDEAHKRDIAVHAWINPYRITRKTATEKSHDVSSLAENHPARLHPEWVVKHKDGNLYFNPGIPEAMNLIIDGVTEIVTNYDIDGIHFDDYFYPDSSFEDATTFAEYGVNYSSVADWRRNNVNLLISKTYTAIKSIDESVQFGISPFGIWANSKTNSLGSDTAGLESYTSHYADTRKWVKEGMIDYIAPQIYWNIGFSIADYSKLLKWWDDVAEGTDVNLYIGHAAYRTGNSDPKSPWYGVDEISRQLNLNQSARNVNGSIFFRYAHIKSSSGLRMLLSTQYNKSNSVFSENELIVGRPYKDVTTTSAFYFVGGSSDSTFPLYLNGKEVLVRTTKGFYGSYQPLRIGVNTFKFEQNGKSVTRTVTRIGYSSAKPLTSVQIVEGTAWPQSLVRVSPGETITLSCKAPIGADVTVSIGGQKIALKPATERTATNGMYSTTFKIDFKVPEYSGFAREIPIGKPVYTLNYKGVVVSKTAEGVINAIMNQSPIVATIVNNHVDSYQTASTSNGSHFILHKGMRDYVTGQRGDFVRLSSNIWVKQENVNITTWDTIKDKKATMSHEVDGNLDLFKFVTDHKPVSGASFNGKTIRVMVSNTMISNAMDLSKQSAVKSINVLYENGHSHIDFELNNPSELGGYELIDDDGVLTLAIKKKFVASNSTLPLYGSRIMIDPGHGGKDNGAIGLMGTLYPEKSVVLGMAKILQNQLQSLGATVIMTRSNDLYLSLGDRLNASRKSDIDLYISLHGDSVGDDSDLSKISGFSVFYKDPLALRISNLMQSKVVTELSRKDRKVKTANFFVIRGTWAPSVLIEAGFMPNPVDYEWMTDTNEQKLFAKVISNAIVEYFKE
ncbi:MAG: family 10 glycosylhydrolase [Clostridia bacterium]|nr:family 10 glycosylhydrolase [Clostridia bacterium]